MEPVISSGGFVMPPIGWLRAVRAICDELDVLMIADEVITGFGRTGPVVRRASTTASCPTS